MADMMVAVIVFSLSEGLTLANHLTSQKPTSSEYWIATFSSDVVLGSACLCIISIVPRFSLLNVERLPEILPGIHSNMLHTFYMLFK